MPAFDDQGDPVVLSDYDQATADYLTSIGVDPTDEAASCAYFQGKAFDVNNVHISQFYEEGVVHVGLVPVARDHKDPTNFGDLPDGSIFISTIDGNPYLRKGNYALPMFDIKPIVLTVDGQTDTPTGTAESPIEAGTTYIISGNGTLVDDEGNELDVSDGDTIMIRVRVVNRIKVTEILYNSSDSGVQLPPVVTAVRPASDAVNSELVGHKAIAEALEAAGIQRTRIENELGNRVTLIEQSTELYAAAIRKLYEWQYNTFIVNPNKGLGCTKDGVSSYFAVIPLSGQFKNKEGLFLNAYVRNAAGNYDRLADSALYKEVVVDNAGNYSLAVASVKPLNNYKIAVSGLFKYDIDEFLANQIS